MTDAPYRTSDRQRANAARYYREHREHRLQQSKARADANRDVVLSQARERYWRTDARQRFAWRANRKAAHYGRPHDVLDWRTLPDGPWTCARCGAACESWDHVPENTRLGSRGERRCRACARLYAVESYWRKRGSAA